MSPLHEGSAVGRRLYPELLRTADVCQKALVTPRQLRWWADKGYISKPLSKMNPGSGSALLWSPSVVDEVADVRHRVAACPFEHRGFE